MPKIISVFYTESAKRDLENIDGNNAKKIILKIKKYTDSKPLENARKLSGVFYGLYRYRIGNYRAIFEYKDNNTLIIINILKIKHRKEIYN